MSDTVVIVIGSLIVLAFIVWSLRSRIKMIDFNIPKMLGFKVKTFPYEQRTGSGETMTLPKNAAKINVTVETALPFLSELVKSLSGSEIITIIAKEKTNELITFLSQAPDKRITVKTGELYERILWSMQNYTEFRIIDQDINRWCELIYPDENIRHNTFNCSREILAYTAACAQRDDAYNLKRVFVVTKGDVGPTSAWKRNRAILTEVSRATSEYPNQIDNRVYFIDAESTTRDIILHRKLLDVKDIVAVNAIGSNIIFREDITYEYRPTTSESTSEVSQFAEDINYSISTFIEVFKKSDSIPDFIQKVDKGLVK